MADIGDKIRHHRESLGWTQADLAVRLGVSQQYVSRVERGAQHDMTLTQAARWARVLGCTIAELV